MVGGSESSGLHQAPQLLLVFLLSRWGGQAALNPELACNNAIKVMRYTRQFWFEVRCALLVQWGTPYGRRYMPSFLKVLVSALVSFSAVPAVIEMQKVSFVVNAV